METTRTAAEPLGVLPLTLNKDESPHYAGVELAQRNPKYRDSSKPFRMTLFANNYGTFEASFELTIGEAEEMRDWLNEFLADEAKRHDHKL